jgi:hypothetical protein
VLKEYLQSYAYARGLRHLTFELTAAYVNSGAYRANLESSEPDTNEE